MAATKVRLNAQRDTERKTKLIFCRTIQTVTVGGKPFPFRSTTVGPGGIYSTLDDLYALDRALAAQKFLSLPVSMMATSPRTAIREKLEILDTAGHGAGWFTSIRYNTAVIWNTGDFSAHKSALVRIPKEKLTIIVLTSAGAPEPEDIALQITDHLLNKKQ